MLIMSQEPRIFHLRYGIILTDYKNKRFTVARMDAADYPLVIVREKIDDPEYMWNERYIIRKTAFTPEQADEILDALQVDNMRLARTLLKRNYSFANALIADGPVELDDMIPDIWYECWKAMEAEITMWRDLPGYTEMDVEEQILF